MLSDTPLVHDRGDFFGYGAYADALTELIDSEATDTPLTVAISGPWGAGKTSLALMIGRRLDERSNVERPHVVCNFNAWIHDDAPHLGAAMAAHVAATANQHRSLWRRLIEPLPAAMLTSRARWRRRIFIAAVALALAIAALWIEPIRHAVEAFAPLDDEEAAQAGTATLALIVILFIGSRLFSALELAASFIDNPASEAARGAMSDVRSQLGRLIRQALHGGRLIVFVDDLERCKPERAIEVCEVANQLLSHEGVVTVLIADMQAIARAADASYPDVSGAGDTGRRYLEKIVQVQLTLPPPKMADMGRLLSGRPAEESAAPPGGGERDAEAAGRPAPVTAWIVLKAMVRTWRLPFARMAALSRGARLVAYASFVVSAVVSFRLLAPFTTERYPAQSQPPPTRLEELLGIDGGAGWFDVFMTTYSALVIAVFATAVAIALLIRRQRRLSRERRELINGVIRLKIAEGEDQSSLEDAVLGELHEEDHDLGRQLVASHLVEFAVELDGVEDVILRYPPGLPRSAKRMLNHARLLTQIARARGLFTGTTPLTAKHLGEWIVISERWPEIARLVEQDPQALGRLEEWAEDGPERLKSELGKPIEDVALLVDLLTTEPLLGDVALRLVHFEADAAVTRPAQVS